MSKTPRTIAQLTTPGEHQDVIDWLKQQAYIFMPGDDKFAYRFENAAAAIEQLQANVRLSADMLNDAQEMHLQERDTLRIRAERAEAKVREALERAALITDEWVLSKSCNKDGTPCEHQRLAAEIGTRIRSLSPRSDLVCMPNDAQAMALVKKLGLDISHCDPSGWMVFSGLGDGIEAFGEDLNRAIYECAAKIQADQKG